MDPGRFLRRIVLAAAVCILLTPAARGQSPPPPAPQPQPAPSQEPAPTEVPPPAPGPGEKSPATEPAFLTAADFSPFGNAVVGHAPDRADLRLTWFPDERVGGQPTNLGYFRQDFTFSTPVWQNGSNEWLAFTNVRGEFFHTHAILPDTGQPFPDELWNIRFGTTYRHLFDNGWIAGATVTVGSASDRPFAGIDEMTAGVNAFVRVPQGEHNAWLFSLSYSPTSELGFPIPGVAFVYQPSDCFRANIGLPFQLMWRPVDRLTLDFSYMLLRTVHARATYRLCPPVGVYVGFDWSNEGYFLVDRPNVNDRLFYYDKRLTAGVQAHLAHNVSLDLSTGYVFDRFYFEGQQYSDNSFNRVDVGNGPFASFQVRVKW